MKNAEIVQAALEVGFMISTMHGQDADKLMPVSDTKTLTAFYKLAKKLESDSADEQYRAWNHPHGPNP